MKAPITEHENRMRTKADARRDLSYKMCEISSASYQLNDNLRYLTITAARTDDDELISLFNDMHELAKKMDGLVEKAERILE